MGEAHISVTYNVRTVMGCGPQCIQRMVDFYRFAEEGFFDRRRMRRALYSSPRAICMGSGGVTPRTWSGPGGSSHKRPLAGTRTYAGRFFRLWSHEVRRLYQLYR